MAGFRSTIRRLRYRYGAYKYPAQIVLVFIVVAFAIRFLWLNNHDAPQIDPSKKLPNILPPVFTTKVDDPSINWDKYAYVLHAASPESLCNALMIFSELAELESQATRVLYYPGDWDPNAIDEYDEAYNLSPTARLLQLAYTTYNVTLQPLELTQEALEADAWSETYTRLQAFKLTNYDRIISLGLDNVVLKSLDELFFMQETPVALPFVYWGEPLGWQLSDQIMVVTPSLANWQQIEKELEGIPAKAYHMDIITKLYSKSLVMLPQRPYNALTGEFRRKTHTEYLGGDKKWDGTKALDEAKFVHFADWPVPKPWIRADKDVLKKYTPGCKPSGWTGRDCKDRQAWVRLYWNFAVRRKDICGAGFELQSRELPPSAVLRHGKWYHVDEVT